MITPYVQDPHCKYRYVCTDVKPQADVIIAHIALIIFLSYTSEMIPCIKWPCLFAASVYTLSLYQHIQTKQEWSSILEEESPFPKAPLKNLLDKQPKEIRLIHSLESLQKRSIHLQLAKNTHLQKHGQLILHPVHAKKLD